MIAAWRVWVPTRDGPALGEPLGAKRGDVDGARAALGDQLGQARADGRRDLEAGAAEGGREIQAVDPAHRAENRVAVGAVAVEGAIAARERGALHRGHAVGEHLRALHRRGRRQARRHRVGIDVPHLARHADDRLGVALRPEVGAEHVVDHDHVRLRDLRWARHQHRVEGLGPRVERDPDLAAEPRRPRAGRHHDGAGVDARGRGLDADHGALAPDDARRRRPL